MDIVRLMLVLASIAAIRVAMAEEQPVVVGSGDSLPQAAEGSSMACRVMSQESVIGEWIRQVRETNDVSLAFDSIVRLGCLHRADWDGANEFLKEACKDGVDITFGPVSGLDTNDMWNDCNTGFFVNPHHVDGPVHR